MDAAHNHLLNHIKIRGMYAKLHNGEDIICNTTNNIDKLAEAMDRCTLTSCDLSVMTRHPQGWNVVDTACLSLHDARTETVCTWTQRTPFFQNWHMCYVEDLKNSAPVIEPAYINFIRYCQSKGLSLQIYGEGYMTTHKIDEVTSNPDALKDAISEVYIRASQSGAPYGFVAMAKANPYASDPQQTLVDYTDNEFMAQWVEQYADKVVSCV